ncbi:MAG TPA: GNAT family N-acetyltransferase [Chloroflexia bacterium]|nr:GNAT family N-acetyltransferase [Chloroflexia bacterium]
MEATLSQTEQVQVPGAPDIPGLTFRRFRGEADYPAMAEVSQVSRDFDKEDDVVSTPESIASAYSNLKNCDPYQDMVMVEMNGKLIGYKRVNWWAELDGTHIYGHFGFLVPEWRGKGIGTALFRHSEARLREIAQDHRDATARFFDVGSSDTTPGLVDLIEREGYSPVRNFYEMLRPDLENIPDMPLPEGVEIRPVQAEELRAIWEAEVEAFKDHWGEWQTEEEDFRRWQEHHLFQPHLWKVAWEGDQVAGMVRNFIDEAANKRFNRKRGWTENISVRRQWRKKGVAKALIAASFRMHKELGMTEAALGVDSENPNGARQLYESMGFKTVKTFTAYRKAMTEI